MWNISNSIDSIKKSFVLDFQPKWLFEDYWKNSIVLQKRDLDRFNIHKS